MVVLGVARSEGTFKADDGKNVDYDNVLLFCVSGDNDVMEKEYSFFTGGWVESYKIKKKLFLNTFSDLPDPYNDVIGMDVMPNFNQYGKVVGFIRKR